MSGCGGARKEQLKVLHCCASCGRLRRSERMYSTADRGPVHGCAKMQCDILSLGEEYQPVLGVQRTRLRNISGAFEALGGEG